MAYYIPPPGKVWGHVPRVLHQIAPMPTGYWKYWKCIDFQNWFSRP